ncbi:MULTISPECIES: helix-turn-helix transcriptional regulator [unclassified Methylobacterium]|uniref:helix-turn-helix transcriptional regulator n=1 Tax=unclassified Methylobacterium TaxID=2615210 RepID=UPI0011C1D35D|nr:MULTISPECIES: helix-turn-helix transcriptional regulator [unclassified Methylobacterium]QEE38824.1 helix-turn-helix transcriptional regulator [Methylobacterium sp. WL1]TXN53620.1 helix-turn-helix transcriptional regulator [Methylobacterium sp. WL2]
MSELPPHREEMRKRLILSREKAGFETASDAARAFGWNENTYRSHENGERGLKISVIDKYARAFRVPFGYIAMGLPGDLSKEAREFIFVSGLIKDDTCVNFGSSDYIRSPARSVAKINHRIGTKFIAMEVDSDAGLSIFAPGDLVLADIDPLGSQVEDGRLVLIHTRSGKSYIRFAHRSGLDGEFVLSANARQRQVSVSVVAVHKIDLIVPAGSWARMSVTEYNRNMDEMPDD